jgi:hypothetical protein
MSYARREFIALLGGAAAAWPLAARAQQGERMRRIGLLSGASREPTLSNYEAFLQGMRELGYIEGRDFIVDYRFADGKYERFPELAAELVRLNPDVLLTGTGAAIRTLQRATTTIPIILAYSTNPVRREPRSAGRQHHRAYGLIRRYFAKATRAGHLGRTQRLTHWTARKSRQSDLCRRA